MKNQRVFWLLVMMVTVLNSARAQVILSYFLDGGNLQLRPDIKGPITSILWIHQRNLLAEWSENNVPLTYHGDYNNRTTLDIKTGYLEIRNMDETKDRGRYTLVANNIYETFRAIAIKEVPKPSMWVKQVASVGVTLTCDGETTRAEPVTYSWKMGEEEWKESMKDLNISKKEMACVKTFSCRMTNPVSERESEPKGNPFLQGKHPKVLRAECFNTSTIKEVPKPSIRTSPASCSPALESCTLTCDGETEEAEPVAYSWRTGDGEWKESTRDLIINESDATSCVKTFSCRMKNPVSEEESEPMDNPFLREKPLVGPEVWNVFLRVWVHLMFWGIVGYLAWQKRDTLRKVIRPRRDKNGDDDSFRASIRDM